MDDEREHLHHPKPSVRSCPSALAPYAGPGRTATVDLKLRVDDTTLLKHTETIPRVCYLWRLNIIHLRVLHFMGPSKSSISVANKKRLIHGGAPPFDGHVSTCFARHVLLDLSAIIKFASPPPLQATSSSSSCSSIVVFFFPLLYPARFHTGFAETYGPVLQKHHLRKWYKTGLTCSPLFPHELGMPSLQSCLPQFSVIAKGFALPIPKPDLYLPIQRKQH